MRYDVVVVGLGAMGSSATYQLAKAGASVLGLDRFTPPHPLGSTHGDTRITRVAIGEGREYVPLVRRAHQLWREIERESGTEILFQCGGLVLGPRASQAMHGSENFLDETVAAARAYGVEHEQLDAEALARRFPQLALAGDECGYFEPGAGFVRPERAVEAQLLLARRLGATIGLAERVLGYDDHESHVTIRTDHQTVETANLVIAAGPWVSELVPDLADHLVVYRQVLYWFDLADRSRYQAFRDMPVYIWWGHRSHDDMIYGFPMIDGPGGGAKVAREQYSTTTTAGSARHDVSAQEIDEMYDEHLRDRLPGLRRHCVKARSCLYTVASQSRFIIARHPEMANVIVVSPCSGHGFKHSAAIGECIAQLAMTGASAIDIAPFGYPGSA